MAMIFRDITFNIKSYKTVTHCIFDLDGTILDSETMYHEVIKDVCAKYGKIYSKDLRGRMYGGTDREICKSLVKELDLKMSADDLEAELEQQSFKALPRAPLQQGAERLLFHLRDNNIPVALATNSTERAVRKHVEVRPKLFGIFHHMVCATDPEVYRGKPYPDLYIVAADRFPDKPKPCKCLVFEDSTVGMNAGITAGMQVVLTPHRPLELRNARKATLVLRDLLDFQPELFGLPPFEKPNGLEEYSKRKSRSSRH